MSCREKLGVQSSPVPVASRAAVIECGFGVSIQKQNLDPGPLVTEVVNAHLSLSLLDELREAVFRPILKVDFSLTQLSKD